MPRGNDSAAAAAELSAQMGGDAPSAEDLIREHRDSIDWDVVNAGMKREDEEASAALDLSKIVPKNEGDEVLSAAVRGASIVYVALGEDGRTYKGVHVPAAPAARSSAKK